MPTFTQIGSAVVVGSGGQASITFTSIPSTYTDLVLKMSLRSDSSGTERGVVITLNASSSGYSGKLLEGNGASAASGNGGTSSITSLIINGTTSTANTFTNTEFYIPNYSGSTNKSLSMDSVLENNATTAYADLAALLLSNTAAITSITIAETGAGKFAQHSTAYLYGVSNA